MVSLLYFGNPKNRGWGRLTSHSRLREGIRGLNSKTVEPEDFDKFDSVAEPAGTSIAGKLALETRTGQSNIHRERFVKSAYVAIPDILGTMRNAIMWNVTS